MLNQRYPARTLFLLFLAITLSTCQSLTGSSKLFRQLSASETGVDFINQLTPNDSITILDFEYKFNGAGVALCDVNNDKLLDLLFTGNQVPARLYLNRTVLGEGGPKFEDITEQSGLKADGWQYGVSVVDINQDGFQDVYICRAGHRQTPASAMRNLFFVNNGLDANGIPTFREAADAMNLADDGYDIQAAFFDYDRDGDLDMYLLRNSIVNYNRNNSRPKQTDGQSPTTAKLYRNEGVGPAGLPTFADVSRAEGITIEGFGLGVSVGDLNNDDWPDVYVSNDFLTNDLVWINQHDARGRHTGFRNEAGSLMRHQTHNGMGNDLADINNDGLTDVMVVDMLPPDNKRWKLTMMGNTYDEFQQNIAYGYEPQYIRNTLQLNNGPSADGQVSFSEVGQLAGVQATDWSWSPLFADYDNDGWKDLLVANGYKQDITNLDFIMYGKRALFMGTPDANRKERLAELGKLPGIRVHSYIYRNTSADTSAINPMFVDMSALWGLDAPGYANGAAYGDLDNDGDLDLVFNNLDEPATIYENRASQQPNAPNWLRVGLTGPTGNRDGLGTKIWLWQGGVMQYQYVSPYRGYLSTVELNAHFGLKTGPVDSLTIRWPNGREETLRRPKSNQLLTLNYRNAHLPENKPQLKRSALLFTEYGNDLNIRYQHREDEFVDFREQPLLPHLNSHNGPGLAVGDVNGDGLDDFYAGGAANATGGLFVQTKTGTFTRTTVGTDTLADDMGALFFDADSDGDADLYVVSGGASAKKQGDAVYQHRLYLNDGTGRFARSRSALPPVNTSGSSVVAADYDHDGDLDLFVGGRVCPGEYPLSPRSFLLRNDSRRRGAGGMEMCRFTDVSARAGADFSRLGMVTSALWTDYDNDTWTDLIVVGEFMPIRFFRNVNGRFSETTAQTGLSHTAGWWNSLVGGDFDKDGDIDYIAGNLGLNSPYHATADEPVCIYAKDYDKNGRLDPVMCHFKDGDEYTVHTRDDINKQMAAMRARFTTYEEYADPTFRESFRADEITDAYVVRSERFASSYLENRGGGKFTISALPTQAQFAPIYGMLCADFTGDGNPDVLAVGNSFATEVNVGRYDAQGSLLLRGDGQGHFTPDRHTLNLTGDNKSVTCLQGTNGASLVLVGSNSGPLRTFRVGGPARPSVPLLPTDAYALITESTVGHPEKKQYRQEFHFGHSYLSQQGRRFTIPAGAQSVIIYDTFGKKRVIQQKVYAAR